MVKHLRLYELYRVQGFVRVLCALFFVLLLPDATCLYLGLNPPRDPDDLYNH